MSPIIRRRGEKFTIPSKYLLLMLTVVCCFLMIITFMTDVTSGPVGEAVGYVVVPFQEGVSTVGSWLSGRADEFQEIKDVLNENQALKDQIAELTVENSGLHQDKYELNNLRTLYKLDEEYSEYEKIGARIIANDSGNWFHSFVINKGTNDGIEIDMNVMAGGGLVGRIIDVGADWAKVTSIIDDDSNVSGMTLATEDNMIVSGDLELMADELIRFSQLVDSDDAVVVGDKVVTSNISDKYLPGILIGYINSIEIDANNLTKSGYITPAVDFEHLEEVLVILQKKQSVE